MNDGSNLAISNPPPKGSLLGIDPGSKTLGLAISDPSQRLALALHTIMRKKLQSDLKALETVIADRNVKGFIIGLPLNMDGSEGPRCQSARAFGRHLHAKWPDLPVAFFDERLTSAEAERAMIEADLSRKRRAEEIDAAAATVILSAALERIQNGHDLDWQYTRNSHG